MTKLLPGRPVVRSVVEMKADASGVAPGNYVEISTVQERVGYDLSVYRIFAESEFVEVPKRGQTTSGCRGESNCHVYEKQPPDTC